MVHFSVKSVILIIVIFLIFTNFKVTGNLLFPVYSHVLGICHFFFSFRELGELKGWENIYLINRIMLPGTIEEVLKFGSQRIIMHNNTWEDLRPLYRHWVGQKLEEFIDLCSQFMSELLCQKWRKLPRTTIFSSVWMEYSLDTC